MATSKDVPASFVATHLYSPASELCKDNNGSEPNLLFFFLYFQASINLLPKHKILDLPKLKAFAQYKIIC